MKKIIIKNSLIVILFYILGRIGYESLYRFTLSLVKSFSTVPIEFFGKFPFWFIGDPIFGIIIAFIPLSIFGIKKILQYSNNTILWVYTLFFIAIYLLICILTSFWLLASNHFYKEGQILSYGLRQVNINEIFLVTILATSFLTIISLKIMKKK